MPQTVAYTVNTQDLGRVLPSITLGVTNDLATINPTLLGIARAVQHTCAAAWEYSQDGTNWYAVAALTPLTIQISAVPSQGTPPLPTYFARSTAGGRLDMLVVR
jgi:hypothetical protein